MLHWYMCRYFSFSSGVLTNFQKLNLKAKCKFCLSLSRVLKTAGARAPDVASTHETCALWSWTGQLSREPLDRERPIKWENYCLFERISTETRLFRSQWSEDHATVWHEPLHDNSGYCSNARALQPNQQYVLRDFLSAVTIVGKRSDRKGLN